MDPFRDDFDVKGAILSSFYSSDVQPCSSIDEFEQNLILNEPKIFRALMQIEEGEFKMFLTNNSVKLGSEISKRERMKRLESICKDGVTPLTSKPVAERSILPICEII